MPTDTHQPGEMEAALRGHLEVATAIYAAHTGVKPSILSGVFLNNTGFFSRLAHGGACSVRSYDRFMSGLSAMWPDDLPWPEGIPRPAPASLAPDQIEQLRIRADAHKARTEGAAGQ